MRSARFWRGAAHDVELDGAIVGPVKLDKEHRLPGTKRKIAMLKRERLRRAKEHRSQVRIGVHRFMRTPLLGVVPWRGFPQPDVIMQVRGAGWCEAC